MWSPFIQQYLQYHARLQYHQNRPFLWLYRFCRLRWRIYWKYISHCSRLLYPTNILVIFSLWINESIYNIIHIQVSAFSGCLLFVGKIEEEEEAYKSRKKNKIHSSNEQTSFIHHHDDDDGYIGHMIIENNHSRFACRIESSTKAKYNGDEETWLDENKTSIDLLIDWPAEKKICIYIHWIDQISPIIVKITTNLSFVSSHIINTSLSWYIQVYSHWQDIHWK